jgi:hypothetical protein
MLVMWCSCFLYLYAKKIVAVVFVEIDAEVLLHLSCYFYIFT